MKPLIQEDTAANTISRALRSQKGRAKLWLKKYNEAMTSNKTIDSNIANLLQINDSTQINMKNHHLNFNLQKIQQKKLLQEMSKMMCCCNC
jgi:hypothetical protein